MCSSHYLAMTLHTNALQLALHLLHNTLRILTSFLRQLTLMYYTKHQVQAPEHSATTTTAQRALAWLSPPRWCPVQQAQQAQLHISDCNCDSPTSGESDVPSAHILHSPSLCEAAQQTPRRPRILIVDSSTMCQQLLCRVLRAADCECLTVGTGAAAVELLLSQKQPEYSCDLVLMAVHTPLLNGIAATKALRKAPHAACPPIVGFTADTSRSTQLQCLRAGMKCVIHKPATQAQIRAAVAAHVDLTGSKKSEYSSTNSTSCGNER
jgi:CheY-like chemotaxis protein